MSGSFSSQEKNSAICRKRLDLLRSGNFKIDDGQIAENLDLCFFRIAGTTDFCKSDPSIDYSSLFKDILCGFAEHLVPFAFAVIGDERGLNFYAATVEDRLPSLKTAFVSELPGTVLCQQLWRHIHRYTHMQGKL
jgi:hypothetical protein